MTTRQILNRSSVREENGCRLCTGYLNSSGYGELRSGGKRWIASRLSYHGKHGPIPDEMCVLHHCDTPSCIQPSHLFLGTRADNAHDCIRKGRKPIGDKCVISKLTEKQAAKIKADPRVLRVIAKDYGVTESAIRHVKTGRSWKAVNVPVVRLRQSDRNINVGEDHAAAKLTEDAVRKIRADTRPNRIVAAEYGVQFGCISKVRNFQRWTHVK